MLDFIIKNSAPIIEKQIKDIITGVASEFNINPHEIDAMLKFVNGHFRIYTFKDNRSINNFRLNKVIGSMTSQIEGYLFGCFTREAKKYAVDMAFVNYIFRIKEGANLYVWLNISGSEKNRQTLKDIL